VLVIEQEISAIDWLVLYRTGNRRGRC